MELVVITRSPEETRALGASIARILRPGDLVLLSGDLGAGKTCLVQGAAAALGVGERVTSPTFVLVRSYDGEIPLTHADVYRLGSMQELIDLGYEELLDPARVTFVEWGDAVAPALPAERMEITLEALDEETRRITVTASGEEWPGRLREAGLPAGKEAS